MMQFKTCHRKKYNVWVCKPPVGTLVANYFDNYRLVTEILEDRTFFTAEEYRVLNQSMDFDDLVRNWGLQFCGANDVVVCGVLDELSVIPLQEAKLLFQPEKGWNSIRTRVDKATGKSVFEWVQMTSNPANFGQETACFVPVPYQMQAQNGIVANAIGVDHGKGDFIVWSSCREFVVNGNVFGLMFDNRGWTDCLAGAPATPVGKPKTLFKTELTTRIAARLYARMSRNDGVGG